MVNMSSRDLLSLIGKPVINEVNIEVGRVISFMTDPTGKIEKVLIKGNGKEYSCYPVERLHVEGEKVFLFSDIHEKVNAIKENIPLIWRKKKVLEKLLKENRILPDIYEKLSLEFEDALKRLKEEAKDTIKELEEKIKENEEILETLHMAKTHLEIEYEIGHVEEEVYKRSLHSMLNGLRDIIELNENLKKMRDSLNNIIVGEEVQEEISEPETESSEETAENINEAESKPESTVTLQME